MWYHESIFRFLLWPNNIPFYCYATFVYMFIQEHVDYLYFLAFINNTAVNICLMVFVGWVYPWSVIAGPLSDLVLTP